MKKFKWLALPVVAALAMVSGCAAKEANLTPELRGVNDKTCLLDTRVDLLEGVSALDAEDGDITPNLEINITPSVEVENGYATFTKAGSYEVVYSVSDSKGKSVQTTSYVTAVGREVYMSNVHTNGFSLSAGGGAEIAQEGLHGDAYAFNFGGAEIAEDIKLTRTFSLVCGVEYTFKYVLESNRAGRIKAAVEGKPVAELKVTEGENSLTFTHTTPPRATDDESEIPTDVVTVELWLGGLEGDVQCSLKRVETQYEEAEGGNVELMNNFIFNEHNVINRDNNAHEVGLGDDKKSAYIEVTEPMANIWDQLMFIDTGVNMTSGTEYTVSFTVDSANDNPYEVFIMHDQWNEDGAKKYFNPKGEVSCTFTAGGGFSGTLWLQARSGTHANKITVSNISVKRKTGGLKVETFGFEPVGVKSDVGTGTVKTEYGKIIYTQTAFGTDWGQNQITGSAFEFSGAAENYVITFKAKATRTVACVFAANTESGWNTFAWERIYIPTEECVFTIRCNEKSLGGRYRFLWQFGTAENSFGEETTVEIYDIEICNNGETEE